MGIITLSREFGSGGETIARIIAEKTGFTLINKKTISQGLAAEFGAEKPLFLSEKQSAGQNTEEAVKKYVQAMHSYVAGLAAHDNLVILGRGGQVLLPDYPASLHVRIIAQFTYRVKRVMRLYDLKAHAAIKLVKEQDRDKRIYYRQVFNTNWANLRSYNLVINTENLVLEDVADMIIAAYRIHAGAREIKDAQHAADFEEQVGAGVRQAEEEEEKFMHPSEEEFAHMLDFYRLRWEYEPKTFLLEWDSEGNILEAFSPDFYLPDQDLFVELTTQKPKQAWKKNRKIKRMKELYPEVNVRLIDKRGFESLLKKRYVGQDD